MECRRCAEAEERCLQLVLRMSSLEQTIMELRHRSGISDSEDQLEEDTLPMEDPRSWEHQGPRRGKSSTSTPRRRSPECSNGSPPPWDTQPLLQLSNQFDILSCSCSEFPLPSGDPARGARPTPLPTVSWPVRPGSGTAAAPGQRPQQQRSQQLRPRAKPRAQQQQPRAQQPHPTPSRPAAAPHQAQHQGQQQQPHPDPDPWQRLFMEARKHHQLHPPTDPLPLSTSGPSTAPPLDLSTTTLTIGSSMVHGLHLPGKETKTLCFRGAKVVDLSWMLPTILVKHPNLLTLVLLRRLQVRGPDEQPQ